MKILTRIGMTIGAILLAGCATPSPDEKMAPWVGKHESDLIASWGPPTSVDIGDIKGWKVLIYRDYVDLGQAPGTIYDVAYGSYSRTPPRSAAWIEVLLAGVQAKATAIGRADFNHELERSLDQDRPVNFEEVVQGEFPCKADGAAFDFTLEKFVFDQGFANLADTDMRIFHLPDLTTPERLDDDAVFLRRVLHGDEFSITGIDKRGNTPFQWNQQNACSALKE